MTHKTFIFTNETIATEGLGDGRHVVKVTPGDTKISAYVRGGKVAYYEAEGAEGEREPLLTMRQDRSDEHVRADFFPGFPDDGLCHICTYDAAADTVLCYTVLDCPPPVDETMGPHTPGSIPFPTS